MTRLQARAAPSTDPHPPFGPYTAETAPHWCEECWLSLEDVHVLYNCALCWRRMSCRACLAARIIQWDGRRWPICQRCSS